MKKGVITSCFDGKVIWSPATDMVHLRQGNTDLQDGISSVSGGEGTRELHVHHGRRRPGPGSENGELLEESKRSAALSDTDRLAQKRMQKTRVERAVGAVDNGGTIGCSAYRVSGKGGSLKRDPHHENVEVNGHENHHQFTDTKPQDTVGIISEAKLCLQIPQNGVSGGLPWSQNESHTEAIRRERPNGQCSSGSVRTRRRPYSSKHVKRPASALEIRAYEAQFDDLIQDLDRPSDKDSHGHYGRAASRHELSQRDVLCGANQEIKNDHPGRKSGPQKSGFLEYNVGDTVGKGRGDMGFNPGSEKADPEHLAMRRTSSVKSSPGPDIVQSLADRGRCVSEKRESLTESEPSSLSSGFDVHNSSSCQPCSASIFRNKPSTKPRELLTGPQTNEHPPLIQESLLKSGSGSQDPRRTADCIPKEQDYGLWIKVDSSGSSHSLPRRKHPGQRHHGYTSQGLRWPAGPELQPNRNLVRHSSIPDLPAMTRPRKRSSLASQTSLQEAKSSGRVLIPWPAKDIGKRYGAKSNKSQVNKGTLADSNERAGSSDSNAESNMAPRNCDNVGIHTETLLPCSDEHKDNTDEPSMMNTKDTTAAMLNVVDSKQAQKEKPIIAPEAIASGSGQKAKLVFASVRKYVAHGMQVQSEQSPGGGQTQVCPSL